MVSYFNEDEFIDNTSISKNTLRELQAEHIIYQANSTSDAKKALDTLRKDTETVIKAMDNARKVAYERKLLADELKIELAEKKDKAKQLQHEIERAKMQVDYATKKTLDSESEANKIKLAIEKIQDATHELDSKYFKKYQEELTNMQVKLTTESQKAQSDLNAAREIEAIAVKKFQDTENEIRLAELETIDRTNEANRITTNVSMTVEHIIKSYKDIMEVSKDLLKTATQIEYAETNLEERTTQYNELTQPLNNA